MIQIERLERNFKFLAKIGAQNGQGITRLAFSDEDWEGRNFVISLMQEAGLSIREDDFGNVIGRREGVNPNAPVVMLGSHIDTVPGGGNFDGVVGVLGAIETLRSMEEERVENYYPIEVVVFMAEESSRFGAATLGSKAFCGKLSKEQLDSYTDKQGLSLGEVLKQRGFNKKGVAAMKYTGKIKNFLEMHIEQGKVLEATGNQIGIVTGIAAPSRYKIHVVGNADHSGATPMTLRQDALPAAAEIILQVEKFALTETEHGTVGTVGVIQAEPGVMNVIPGKVDLGVDIRGIALGSKQKVITALMKSIREIEARRKVKIIIDTISDDVPVKLDDAVTNLLYDLSNNEGIKVIHMSSGAGHDAMHIAEIAPTGMIFIPCKGGISHNKSEFAKIEDIVAGTEILLAAILKLARRE